MDTLLFVLPFQQQDDRPYTDHAEIRSTSTSLPGSVQLPCKSECSVPFTRTEASYTVLSPSESSADCESKIPNSISKTITPSQAHVYTFSAGAILNIDVLIKTL